MTKLYKNTDESKKEFYFYLGLLSTLFAKMESNLLIITGKLITDDFVLASVLFERNTLAQNIDLIKKISVQRDFEINLIKNLADKISNIKRIRNLFIHGVWGEPYEKNNDVLITCSESKIDSVEKKFGAITAKSWKSVTTTEFRLTYIRKQVDHVEEIILSQNFLIKKLEEHVFNNF
ncbi:MULTISPECIES: hypothetical protein [Flavobacterium]|uniref:hypothetical protein n=1 Tax=Flavobacterium TaxID=237 RepID=UPI0021145FFB|nr:MULTISPECIES: hypothetical protein [Flavobacterium]UUF15167.1 hypothetical protein NLJ00_03465 [Flavobacterium panici]